MRRIRFVRRVLIFKWMWLACWHLLTLICTMDQKRVMFSSSTIRLADGGTLTCNHKRSWATITTHKCICQNEKDSCPNILCSAPYWCLWGRLRPAPQSVQACNLSLHWPQSPPVAWVKQGSSLFVHYRNTFLFMLLKTNEMHFMTNPLFCLTG